MDTTLELVFRYLKEYKLILSLTCKNWKKLIDDKKYVTNTTILLTPALLKWSMSLGYELTISTSYTLAYYGRLETLQWARTNGCPWDEDICANAAMRGHLEVLQWARANGCPWDGYTCAYAANRGHLEVLQWARANGCPE